MDSLVRTNSVQELLKRMDAAYEAAEVHNLVPKLPEKADGISVIMIVYHTGTILYQAIERVLNDPNVTQFILIDNGSPAKDAEKLRQIKEQHKHILLVQGHGNIGFGRAANLGAFLANKPHLVFLNPDAFVEGQTIKKLVEASRRGQSPCIVGARILNPDRSEQRGGRRGEVTPVTTFLTLTRLTRFVPGWDDFDIHREKDPTPAQIVSVPTISGACFAISRSDFHRLKGFDTRFFLHVEDIDLCWRARQMGGDVLFNPTANVVHAGHTSHVDPLFVEWNKGIGLVYYFFKRADTLWRKTYVSLFAPIVLGVSVLRSLFRKTIKREK